MTEKNDYKPYIPAHVRMPELTIKALVLGIVMAVVLGAANAYLGLKAGMTISATFPAAVIAIAAFRLPFFKGNVLEQNIARTAASVGEALVAGAIFTVPAFVMVRMNGQHLWKTFHYWETSFILLIGGTLGILFVIILRRTLVVDADLPFPESYACYEIVKAGQKGESGAGRVFGAMGIGVVIELLKNTTGFTIFQESVEIFIKFPKSVIHHLSSSRVPMGDVTHTGGIAFSTPLASPALMGVGYIIGPKLSAINFSGSVIAWLVLIPLALFLNPALPHQLTLHGAPAPWKEIVYSVWYNQVRPIAVGAMLVGSLYTLYGLRNSLGSAFKGIFSKPDIVKDEHGFENRLEKDLNLRSILLATIALIIPMFFLYYYFSDSFWGAMLAAVVMLITGFLFAAVGGWLVGLVGGSNQPISGLTLSALIVAAVLMVAIGVTGLHGIAAVLAVAAVVCAATSMAGDMIQDLKVGHLLGGTPIKMEIAEIASVLVVSFVLVFPMIILHEGNIAAGGIGIGDVQLPAPQAGLMAELAKGIVGGQMAWGLVIVGMFFSISLIMVDAPAPMLIAVGMYLPFETTFSIFVGGIIRWVSDEMMKKKKLSEEDQERVTNTGILVASGFIAGEALTGVFLAGLVLSGIRSLTKLITGITEFSFVHTWGIWLSLIIFAIVAYGFIVVPMRVLKK
ncbi:OPT oligopeptide transporter protein [bacterium BMS3Abin05]|nr:OPT oligopeptide transporter protein [bacterium BMS3Abin05]GBE26498.1 OPT oligopeptide transporter protein [bacterium BMS3Bbin03]